MILTSYNVYISSMRFKRTIGVIHICVSVKTFPNTWQWSKLIVESEVPSSGHLPCQCSYIHCTWSFLVDGTWCKYYHSTHNVASQTIVINIRSMGSHSCQYPNICVILFFFFFSTQSSQKVIQGPYYCGEMKSSDWWTRIASHFNNQSCWLPQTSTNERGEPTTRFLKVFFIYLLNLRARKEPSTATSE